MDTQTQTDTHTQTQKQMQTYRDTDRHTETAEWLTIIPDKWTDRMSDIAWREGVAKTVDQLQLSLANLNQRQQPV